jgi:hypothetical protein
MCKEMSVIPVNKVVDPKRISKKMDGLGGEGEAQGGTDPPKKLFGKIFFQNVNIGLRLKPCNFYSTSRK